MIGREISRAQTPTKIGRKYCWDDNTGSPIPQFFKRHIVPLQAATLFSRGTVQRCTVLPFYITWIICRPYFQIRLPFLVIDCPVRCRTDTLWTSYYDTQLLSLRVFTRTLCVLPHCFYRGCDVKNEPSSITGMEIYWVEHKFSVLVKVATFLLSSFFIEQFHNKDWLDCSPSAKVVSEQHDRYQFSWYVCTTEKKSNDDTFTVSQTFHCRRAIECGLNLAAQTKQVLLY